MPSAGTFLVFVLAFGALAIALRTVSWMAAVQLDRLVLAVTYVVGVLGYALTSDPALIFAPPTATLGWMLVGRYVGDSPRTPRQSGATARPPASRRGRQRHRTRGRPARYGAAGTRLLGRRRDGRTHGHPPRSGDRSADPKTGVRSVRHRGGQRRSLLRAARLREDVRRECARG
ncbi:hypothetical protein D8S78_06270 [Natrialba swarupiae]|nr:hypothetical protein [Natrialba swarupiae]